MRKKRRIRTTTNEYLAGMRIENNFNALIALRWLIKMTRPIIKSSSSPARWRRIWGILKTRLADHYTTHRSRNESSLGNSNRTRTNDKANNSNSRDNDSRKTHSQTFLEEVLCHRIKATSGCNRTITLERTPFQSIMYYSQCSDQPVSVIRVLAKVFRIFMRRCLIPLVVFLMASDGIKTCLRIISSSNLGPQIELMEAAFLTTS